MDHVWLADFSYPNAKLLNARLCKHAIIYLLTASIRIDEIGMTRPVFTSNASGSPFWIHYIRSNQFKFTLCELLHTHHPINRIGIHLKYSEINANNVVTHIRTIKRCLSARYTIHSIRKLFFSLFCMCLPACSAYWGVCVCVPLILVSFQRNRLP